LNTGVEPGTVDVPRKSEQHANAEQDEERESKAESVPKHESDSKFEEKERDLTSEAKVTKN